MREGFAGDKKTGQPLLGPVERRFINWAIPKVTKPIMRHHLTALTAVWSVAVIVFGKLAVDNHRWLHASSWTICSTSCSRAAQTSRNLWQIDYEANIDGQPR
jgi:hypothetical protein